MPIEGYCHCSTFIGNMNWDVLATGALSIAPTGL